MAKGYEVFLSYHGGGEEGDRSSYGKAAELCEYLESRGLSCFLCKRENPGDHYDAINAALGECRHFILVASRADMLSLWIEDEVKQFDGLRKNGEKPHCLISAYIFGEIQEKDLWRFNTLFATKDIAKGAGGFERLFYQIREKDALLSEAVPVPEDEPTPGAEAISLRHLPEKLQGYREFDEEVFARHCEVLTERLKCMTEDKVSEGCCNIIEELYLRIVTLLADEPRETNLFRIIGQAGTQKSYVLQMLYIYLVRHYADHDMEPVYLHCDKIRRTLEEEDRRADAYLASLLSGLTIPKERRPVFIIDGLLNIVTEDKVLDFELAAALERFPNARRIVGINQVFRDNDCRLNRSPLVKGRYKQEMNMTPISLYDREKCLRYIGTLPDLPCEDPEEVYRIMNGSGLITIDEFVIRKLLEDYDEHEGGEYRPDIMEIFEYELESALHGDREQLSREAAFVFSFAYERGHVDFRDPRHRLILGMVASSTMYLNCLIALHFCDKLDEYGKTGDASFFSMVFPKDVTRFITKKVNAVTRYESTILKMAERYHEMPPLGQSELSFFLGRIKTAGLRARATDLLRRYYSDTREMILRHTIDDKYNSIPYLENAYRQDLFLLRGLSVSLIYCGDTGMLYEYLRFLLDNDLANAINRGFHLEYYGDKKYLPNQDMLDYMDVPEKGERTLRILCNSVETQLKSNCLHPAMLLELFTVVSLLQKRIETERGTISFNILPYIRRCCGLVGQVTARVPIEDSVLSAFFRMATEDFTSYLERDDRRYSPQRELCNEYLASRRVKRTGWVMQGVRDTESIMEHMYATWFIGLVFLPNECEQIPGYDKQKILSMLIVHDLAETKLEDIPKYEKPKIPDYDKREHETMLTMLLKGTYDSMSTLDGYVEAWSSWYERKEENARIAKDIDTVQAIYQFLVYYLEEPGCFSEERVLNWLREVYEVKTALGHEILQELVLKNERFREVLLSYEGRY